ncbi:MAG: hypothetical protein IAA97_01550 [Spirochaetes bacterium]|uniref:Uncharacterized protein n=1 Tax=Candidatus Ornithospirochaeta stercoripullorum TaxID=2840899 RepID=A0A9D9H1N2_9SPIO|nr:hypothetical protein [Candidatus Ornithospirochaeta stercoripullorum]
MADSMKKMLRMLGKGKTPDASDLSLGREEFVALVTSAVNDGFVEDVYISFCDSAPTSSLLSGAKLTEKGRKRAKGFFH